MAERLCAGGDDRAAGEGCRGDGRIVDEAVDDHLDHLGLDLDRVDGDLGDLPGELLFAGQLLFGAVDADVMGDGHDDPSGREL
ncbi:hypothetical protein GCM10025863_29230 [Microbacterium suwonense]|uniref:Uncharacterized protein n=1 Tax=Microbacterium suwonense TaxID=683047 RepID=A0ABN6X6L3_9MICO|nr:hypothetical protein GCM10025863_29230 [Microbacterium suwonense]